jgi:hypothetical protein
MRWSLRRVGQGLCAGAIGAFVAAALLVPMTARASAGSDKPITIVRAGAGNLEGIKASLTRAYLACAEHLKIKGAMPSLPSDRVLSGLVLYEAEELFDGPHWALYESFGTPAADPQRQCGWVIYWQRNAVAETACQRHESGRSAMRGLPQDLGLAPVEPAKTASEALDAGSCRDKQRTPNLQGVPRQSAGQGLSCVWARDLLSGRIAALAAKMPSKKPQAEDGAERSKSQTDVCLYDELPYYWSNGKSRNVMLMNRADLMSADGSHAVPTAIGETQAVQASLRKFSMSVISADKFSRASIDRFIALPNKSAVEETK